MLLITNKTFLNSVNVLIATLYCFNQERMEEMEQQAQLDYRVHLVFKDREVSEVSKKVSGKIITKKKFSQFIKIRFTGVDNIWVDFNPFSFI